MKKILGLDLGTNSIGWALVEHDFEAKNGKILGMGSRIIPMDAAIMGDFDKGNSVSQTAERTGYRGHRRLYERHHQRRERLHRVLNVLGFLPKHYANQIDFEKHLGQFLDEKEPKLVWKQNENGKFEFLFQKSFNEMVEDFKANGQEIKIPYDWTIYYLRKKALTKKIEKEELAWIILNFNQKRGYYQLRGEEEEKTNVKEFVQSLKVISIEKGETDKKNDKKTWYKMTLENGWEYYATFTTEPNWLNAEKEFLVTEEYDDDGSIKIVKDKKTDTTGKEKRRITPLPSFDEINLMSKEQQDKIYKKIKARTEITISNTGKTVGTYIYETLLQKPTQKIRGKLVRTIERKFYKDELIAILKKQIELQPELFTEDLYNDCIRELYRNNEAQQLVLSKRDFVHLFVNDIIFYQRPLRSQKSSIGNCSLEYRKHKNKDGNEITEYLKAIPKSNPLYQEFRLWQWLFNLKIYKKDNDADVTEQFITGVTDKENLFDFLNNRKEIDQKALLKYLKLTDKTYRWNYVEDKTYPCNETGTQIRTRLAKVENFSTDFLTSEFEQKLWHIIYSVTDKNEFEKALKTFANKHNLDEISFVENFKKFPPFKSEYGSFSEKAIKKLLPLMRLGKYWNENDITDVVKNRANSIKNRLEDVSFDEKEIEKISDDDIPKQVLKSFLNVSDFMQGLKLYQASYIVYGRHSEAENTKKWQTIADLEKYLEEFKQHSLRNPIVEQVITETLRVVRDIWKKYGDFSEIHIELGREMKNTADERKRLTNIVTENENTNLRIKALIMELKEYSDIENVRPYSPIQQEILKIYEDGVINSNIEIPEDIVKISKTAQPSKSELQRYKLWLEQKYRSPYTGQIIPLGKLFTEEYQIEHIIPKSRYFDDSLSNKVICEAAVNQLKDKFLGLEFIKNYHGQVVDLGFGKSVKIFEEDAYLDFVKEHYAKNRSKRAKLLLEEIPEKMIERQMNDTRYISKFISQLLSNIVRADKDDDGVNSKNILPGNGKITTTLKQDWGLNDVWNNLILPRFERLNTLTNSTAFTAWNKQYQKFLPTVPLELSKGFQKKRIDHRHHAMDALVIACATCDHINLLNNQSAKSDISRYDLQNKLRNKEKETYFDKTENKQVTKDVFKEFKKPWDNFVVDAKEGLEKIVISFKQNLRVINKATNKYEKIKDGKKVEVKQEGTNWAIRKPLHKETVYAKVDLPHIKVPKGKFITAGRTNLDTSFDLKKIETITDTGIQKILKNYLAAKGNNPELAFSPEGIEEMNNNILIYNAVKNHKPILKVRTYEIGSRFALGTKGNKKDKYVEAAKGTNLFFAIYADENGNRSYETNPLNIVIERLKQGLKEVPEMNEKGNYLLFHLSPNDLVYVPTEDEKENIRAIDWKNLDKEQIKRIYKIVSFTSSRLYAIPVNVSTSIVNKVEFTQLNKIEFIDEKKYCIKLNVDRLGNIKPTF